MTYSQNVHAIRLPDKELLLIGTAHISKTSTEEVRQVIEAERPETVCVELCASRKEALQSADRWKNMDIFRVIKEDKTFLLLANLIMAAFQKRLGDQLGVQPGNEMLEAMTCAKQIEAQIVLADRDIQTTLRRTWRSLSFWERSKSLSELMVGLFVSEKITPEEIEKLKESDALSEAMEGFAKQVPTAKRILIDERDQYLAEKIRLAPGKKIVAVVGAGHVPGIRQELERTHDLKALEEVPAGGPWGKIMQWLIPLLLVGLIVYGFFHPEKQITMEMVKRWVLITGSLGALGSIAAWGHPLTILATFLAAPITTIHPALAAGWVAGIVEATVRKPQVRDFENLTVDTNHILGFWRNKVTRILLVVVFANIGASLGTLAALSSIAALL